MENMSLKVTVSISGCSFASRGLTSLCLWKTPTLEFHLNLIPDFPFSPWRILAGTLGMLFLVLLVSVQLLQAKHSHSSLWKLISGILGILCLGLVATVTSLAFMILSNQGPNNTSSSHSNSLLSLGYHCGPCPVNWVNYRNSCYLISMERKTWQDSHMICVSQNSSLLKIDSMEELVDSSFQHCLLFCPGLQVQTGDGSNGRIS
uniref:C-type lectin domain-containing protein n=1 Tax=Ornithorhynchus anatinus TaxID=9258 RepID=A0A6I8NH30_ORNAN